ncbi:MAG: chemotaxis protein CheB [Actinobacteria bacterium]|nr:chemotaxis protein CheB [Actinomycetota bacterium]
MTVGGTVRSFGVVVLVASAGGVGALTTVAAGLPEWFQAPILVVQHRAERAVDLLPKILAARSSLPVGGGVSGPLQRGITVVPAKATVDIDTSGGLSIRDCPSGRPADQVLTAVAKAFGPRVLAVVLTGRLSDGADGVRSVKRAGGRVLAQDPADAHAPDMPRAALATGCVEHVVPLHMIAPALVAYTMAPGAADLLSVPLAPWAQLGAALPLPA